MRWVHEFLLFARGHGGYTFDQTLDMFLAEIGGRAGVKPREIQQVADAVRMACSTGEGCSGANIRRRKDRPKGAKTDTRDALNG